MDYGQGYKIWWTDKVLQIRPKSDVTKMCDIIKSDVRDYNINFTN